MRVVDAVRSVATRQYLLARKPIAVALGSRAPVALTRLLGTSDGLAGRVLGDAALQRNGRRAASRLFLVEDAAHLTMPDREDGVRTGTDEQPVMHSTGAHLHLVR